MADMSRKPPVNKNKTKNLPAAEKKEEENRPQTRRWQKQLLVSTRQFCGTHPHPCLAPDDLRGTILSKKYMIIMGQLHASAWYILGTVYCMVHIRYIQWTVYNMVHIRYSIQYCTYKVQYSVWYILGTVYNMVHIGYSIQYGTKSLYRADFVTIGITYILKKLKKFVYIRCRKTWFLYSSKQSFLVSHSYNIPSTTAGSKMVTKKV